MIDHRLISSKNNDHFKRWQSLLNRKGIKKHSQLLVFGEKVISEIKNDFSDLIVESLLPEGADSSSKNCYWLSKELFNEIDIFGTASEILVLQRPNILTWNPEAKAQGLTLLCPLGDPSNLGALMRSATAFGVENFVLLREASSPFHPKATRASSGTFLRLKLLQGPSLRELQPQKNWLALDMNGEKLSEYKWPTNPVVIVGEEGVGILDHSIHKVRVPMNVGIESLNAGVATSILLYDYFLDSNSNTN